METTRDGKATMSVKRYMWKAGTAEESYAGALRVDEDGDYVLASDYERLAEAVKGFCKHRGKIAVRREDNDNWFVVQSFNDSDDEVLARHMTPWDAHALASLLTLRQEMEG